MEDLIQRLDQWLQQNRPVYYGYLQPGLTDEQLRNFEETLGIKLPLDFQLFYKWRNGRPLSLLSSGFSSLVPGFTWLSAEGVVSNLSHWEGAEEVAVNWWHPRWIPFLTDDTSIFICLDMQGSFEGKVGQVDGDEPQRNIMHENFAKWLETIVVALERRLFTGDEGSGRFIWLNNYIQLLYEINPDYPIENEVEF